MHSPISPIVANQFMEELEIKATNTSTIPPRIWFKYVDDTDIIQKAEHSYQFLQHISSIDPCIQFTAEAPTQMDPYPFWIIQVSLGPNNTLLITVYRKPTHRLVPSLGQPPHLSAKYSVFNTLTHRAMTVCTNQQLLQKEEEHIKGALQRHKFPNWPYWAQH